MRQTEPRKPVLARQTRIIAWAEGELRKPEIQGVERTEIQEYLRYMRVRRDLEMGATS